MASDLTISQTIANLDAYIRQGQALDGFDASGYNMQANLPALTDGGAPSGRAPEVSGMGQFAVIPQPIMLADTPETSPAAIDIDVNGF